MGREAFAYYMPVFVSTSCFTGLGQSNRATHMSVADFFRFILNSIGGEKALKSEETRHFWNPIIHKGSGTQDKRLRQSGVVQNMSTNQMLIHHLINDAGHLMYGIRHADLDV